MPAMELSGMKFQADFMQFLAACHQSFASAPDTSLIICDIESLNLPQPHITGQLHNIDNKETLVVEQLQSCLVQHFCVEACEIVPSENSLPSCRQCPDDNLNDMHVKLLDAILKRKIKQRPAHRLLTALGIGYKSLQGVNQLRKLLNAHLISLKKGKAQAEHMRHIA
jgi:hypothetical protein